MSRELPPLPKYGKGGFGFQRSATHVHRGIDLTAPTGTPVYAVAPGIVSHASAELAPGFSGYGGHVVIDTGAGAHLLYAHLSRVDVAPGQRVELGQTLGAVGRTCFTRSNPRRLCGGAHLHFEVSALPYPRPAEGERMDPVTFLTARSAHPLASLPVGPEVVTRTATRSAAPAAELELEPTRQAQGFGGLIVVGVAGLLLALAAGMRRSA